MAVAALVCGGCGQGGRRSVRLRPAYVDLTAVTLAHPGWRVVRLLDARLDRLAKRSRARPAPSESIPRQVVLQGTAPLPPPPPPPDLTQTVEKQAELIGAQLSRGIAERVRLRRQELEARSQQEVAKQRREAERILAQKRSEIYDRYLLPVQNARLAVAVFDERLKIQAQMTQAEIEAGQRKQQELSRLEQEMGRQLAQAEKEMETSVRQVKDRLQAEHAQTLAAYRTQLEREAREQARKEGQATTAAMTEAMDRLRRAFSARPAGPQVLDFGTLARGGGAPAPSLADRVEGLRAGHVAIWRHLREQVRAEVVAEGCRRGLAISFRQPSGSKLADYTRQARAWVSANPEVQTDRKERQ